jgi:gamma-polyglutamate biosynthesis protein CapA
MIFARSSKNLKVLFFFSLLFLLSGILVITILISKKDDEAMILIVGDMNFDRYIREVMVEKGNDFIFSCIADTLKKTDLVLGNLEGPITNNPSISIGTEIGSPANYIFTFPSNTAQLLKNYNIKLVNIGNNHINDLKTEGFLSTKEYLKKSRINHVGGLNGDEPIYRTKLGGTKISFISYNQFGGDSFEKVSEKVAKEYKDRRLVIVYAHWGEEYGPVTTSQRNIAKVFSESGARLVVGSHPHIISMSEKIGNTVIYYSLGNFMFDQYWNPEVRTGLTLEMHIKNNKMEIIERKVVLNRDGRTCLTLN